MTATIHYYRPFNSPVTVVCNAPFGFKEILCYIHTLKDRFTIIQVCLKVKVSLPN